jgi:hypothetical protein
MPTTLPLHGPVLLDKGHEVAGFDCGIAPLNDFLRKHAGQNQQNRSSRTYVAVRGDWVVGYYSLAADDPEYIVRLVDQVVRVSLETVRIVNGLPNEFAPAAS